MGSIKFDHEPIGHVAPRPRIDLSRQRTREEAAVMTGVDKLRETARLIEAERIWAITRQSAEGTNPPENT